MPPISRAFVRELAVRLAAETLRARHSPQALAPEIDVAALGAAVDGLLDRNTEALARLGVDELASLIAADVPAEAALEAASAEYLAALAEATAGELEAAAASSDERRALLAELVSIGSAVSRGVLVSVLVGLLPAAGIPR